MTGVTDWFVTIMTRMSVQTERTVVILMPGDEDFRLGDFDPDNSGCSIEILCVITPPT